MALSVGRRRARWGLGAQAEPPGLDPSPAEHGGEREPGWCVFGPQRVESRLVRGRVGDEIAKAALDNLTPALFRRRVRAQEGLLLQAAAHALEQVRAEPVAVIGEEQDAIPRPRLLRQLDEHAAVRPEALARARRAGEDPGARGREEPQAEAVQHRRREHDERGGCDDRTEPASSGIAERGVLGGPGGERDEQEERGEEVARGEDRGAQHHPRGEAGRAGHGHPGQEAVAPASRSRQEERERQVREDERRQVAELRPVVTERESQGIREEQPAGRRGAEPGLLGPPAARHSERREGLGEEQRVLEYVRRQGQHQVPAAAAARGRTERERHVLPRRRRPRAGASPRRLLSLATTEKPKKSPAEKAPRG